MDNAFDSACATFNGLIMIKKASTCFLGILLFLCGSGVFAQALTAEWTRKADVDWLPNGPGPRAWSNLFWDSNAQRLALFGGSAGGGYKADIWHYNVTADTWTSILQPALDCPGYFGFTAPDGRDAHSSGYDSVNNAYWSVAGSGYKCGAANAEVLPLRTAGAGTTSTSIIDPGLTQTTPDFYKHWTVLVDNYYQALITAYDPVTKKLTLASAVTGLAVGKTYTIRVSTDGQTWYYPLPVPSPPKPGSAFWSPGRKQ